jgi:hypothetical protein
MKFFTPDLLNRFGSADDNIASGAQEELEARSEDYFRQLRQIDEKLTPRLRELLHQFYLHDSQVVSHSFFGISAPPECGYAKLSELTHEATRSMEEAWLPSFWIHLQLDTPPRETLVLQYRSVLIEQAELHQSLEDEECPHLEWLYDEVELIPTGQGNDFRHSIIFTKGLELRLRFKDFDFATLKPTEIAPAFAEAQVLFRPAQVQGERH